MEQQGGVRSCLLYGPRFLMSLAFLLSAALMFSFSVDSNLLQTLRRLWLRQNVHSVKACCPSREHGFWLKDKTLYLTTNHECQYEAYHLQLQFLSNYHTNKTDLLGWSPYDELRDLSYCGSRLPLDWPSQYDAARQFAHRVSDLSFIYNRTFLLLGDSLDRHIFLAACKQMKSIPDRIRSADSYEYNEREAPWYCKSVAHNVTFYYQHIWGVMQEILIGARGNKKWVIDRPETQHRGLNVAQSLNLLEHALAFINVPTSAIGMIMVNSALWDISNWNISVASVRADTVYREVWRAEYERQIVQGIHSLPYFTSSIQFVVRASPPTRHDVQVEEELAFMNQQLRLLVANHSLHLFPMDVILSGREAWTYDAHHYAESTSLVLFNVLLNLFADFHKQC